MPVFGINDFERDLDEFSVEVEEDANQTKRKLALLALRGVTFLTSVDTGRARGGWQVSLNVPEEGDSGRIDKNGNSTVGAGLQGISRALPGDPIWLTNNVEYIIFLNDGTDRMVGVHMLERGVQAAITNLR